MKKSFLKKWFISAASFAVAANFTPVTAQETLKKEVQDTKYLRNSVCLIMMEDASVPQKNILRDAFINAKWNNKYNNHNISIDKRIIDPAKMTLTQTDIARFNTACTPTDQFLANLESGVAAPTQTLLREGAFSDIMRHLMAEATTTIDTVLQINAARMANKYLVENHVAKACFDKWFLNDKGEYTDEVILDRGMLNTTAKDREIAAASMAARQKLIRENCDEDELLGNTFVVVSRFSYKEKDALVDDRMLPLYAAAQADDSGTSTLTLNLAKMGIKASLGAGYYVVVDSYLFRLRWNDRIKNDFYNMWDEKGLDMERYNNARFPALQFIGNERAWAKTRAGVFTDKDENELIRMAAVDAVDAVLAKFERKYDQFKTKTPLHVIESKDKKGRSRQAYAVELGSRDGLNGGEIFEVLEVVNKKQDDGTMKTIYNKKGELKVDKKNVWDNTFSTTENTAAAQHPYTLLSGKDKQTYYEGMLLRLKTTKK